MGFEPTVRLPVHLISNQAHSSTLSPLRWVVVGGMLVIKYKRGFEKECNAQFKAEPSLKGWNFGSPCGLLVSSTNKLVFSEQTHGTVARTPDSESGTFVHSVTSPLSCCGCGMLKLDIKEDLSRNGTNLRTIFVAKPQLIVMDIDLLPGLRLEETAILSVRLKRTMERAQAS